MPLSRAYHSRTHLTKRVFDAVTEEVAAKPGMAAARAVAGTGFALPCGDA